MLAPTHSFRTRRQYRNHTLILETTHITKSGKVKVTDFMPIRGKHSDIVRLVHGMEGHVSMAMTLSVRFDYGRSIPWLQHHYKNNFSATSGPGTAYLRTPAHVVFRDGNMLAEFEVREGQTIPFVLTYASSFQDIPQRVRPKLALRQTEGFWRRWTARGIYKGKWAAEVERSLITLKALTYRPTGGIVAAPTTSLPERRGGALNWDYRFCWLRDATFTLLALMNAGHSEEAGAWQQWLVRTVGGDASQVQILYGLRGERQIPESQTSLAVRLRKIQAGTHWKCGGGTISTGYIWRNRRCLIPGATRDNRSGSERYGIAAPTWSSTFAPYGRSPTQESGRSAAGLGNLSTPT